MFAVKLLVNFALFQFPFFSAVTHLIVKSNLTKTLLWLWSALVIIPDCWYAKVLSLCNCWKCLSVLYLSSALICSLCDWNQCYSCLKLIPVWHKSVLWTLTVLCSSNSIIVLCFPDIWKQHSWHWYVIKLVLMQSQFMFSILQCTTSNAFDNWFRFSCWFFWPID